MDSNTHLVTAKGPDNHITPVDIRRYQALTEGRGTMIRAGCEVSLYDNNTVLVQPGELIVEGCFLIIPEQVQLPIQSSAPNGNRNDLVVLHYKLDAVPADDGTPATGISEMPLEVVPGTPVIGEPTDPPLIQGSIQEGAIEAQVPFSRIKVRGLEIEEPELLITRCDPFGDGNIYLSGHPMNPAQAFGGVWEKLDTHLFVGVYAYKRLE